MQGKGDYVDDLVVDGTLHLAFVRSPFAHARIHVADVETARAAPGVVGVFTAADLDLPAGYLFFEVNPDCARPPLAPTGSGSSASRSRWSSPRPAPRPSTRSSSSTWTTTRCPAVVDMEEALAPGAPLQFDAVPGNVVGGERDPDDVEDALAGADRVVRVRIENPRLAVAPMEGNAVLVIPAATGRRRRSTSPRTSRPRCRTERGPPSPGPSSSTRSGYASSRRSSAAAFGGKAGFSVEHTVAVARRRPSAGPAGEAGPRPGRRAGSRSMQGRAARSSTSSSGSTVDGRFTGLRCRDRRRLRRVCGFRRRPSPPADDLHHGHQGSTTSPSSATRASRP